MSKKNSCYFCIEGIRYIDYKNRDLLRRFISQRAKIVPPRRSGVCAKHQRQLARAIKRARFMAILPYVSR